MGTVKRPENTVPKVITAVTTVVKETKRNPKRMQRDAKKQMRETGIGTKS